jgi:hypothetical protein
VPHDIFIVHVAANTTPWWLLALPALTGLLGVAVGIWGQRHANRDNWLHHERLRAYIILLDACHDYSEIIPAYSLKRITRADARAQVGPISAAAKRVGLIAPRSVAHDARHLASRHALHCGWISLHWDDDDYERRLMEENAALIGLISDFSDAVTRTLQDAPRGLIHRPLRRARSAVTATPSQAAAGGATSTGAKAQAG